MERPNLFNDAPKELSQDGYLSWLLSWSDPKYREVDIALHECGVSFVRLLVSKQLPELAASLEIEKVKVARQWKRIDVTTLINDTLRIIIEDKVEGAAWKGQLERYKSLALNDRGGDADKLICIFLKTENGVGYEPRLVSECGYAPMLRSDLLEFFAPFNIDNNIFRDYHDHLLEIDRHTVAFESKPIREWTDVDWVGHTYSWQGLFCLIESNMPVEYDPWWGYIHLGDFWCISWNARLWGEYPVHLHIRHSTGDLCFMIRLKGHGSQERRLIRDRWSERVLGNARAKGLPVHRPVRFGNGESMCVAVVHRADWLGSEDSVIDKDVVLSRLRSYDEFFLECVNNN
jgi:hypothetical protein